MRAPFILVVLLVTACQPPESRLTSPSPALSASIVPAPLIDLVVPPRQASPTGRSPVLVLLHGVGSNERDLVGLADRLDPRFAVHSLRAPISMGPESFGWFAVRFTPEGPLHDPAAAEEARVRLASFLRELRARKDVDADHVYVMGFSQGAILGLSLALTEPDLMAGVVAMSGRTLQEVAASVRGQPRRGPPVLLTHGTQDTKLPLRLGEESRDVLAALGVPHAFRTYDAPHTVTAAMVSDIDAWLTAQLRAARPDPDRASAAAP